MMTTPCAAQAAYTARSAARLALAVVGLWKDGMVKSACGEGSEKAPRRLRDGSKRLCKAAKRALGGRTPSRRHAHLARCRRDTGEMKARYRRDKGEIRLGYGWDTAKLWPRCS